MHNLCRIWTNKIFRGKQAVIGKYNLIYVKKKKADWERSKSNEELLFTLPSALIQNTPTTEEK